MEESVIHFVITFVFHVKIPDILLYELVDHLMLATQFQSGSDCKAPGELWAEGGLAWCGVGGSP